MRHFEKGSASSAQVQSLADIHRRCADGLRNPGCCVERHLVLTQQRTNARGVIGVAMGQEHGGNVREVPSDPGQKPPQPATRESGIHEKPPFAGLDVDRITRAAARKDAEPQDRLRVDDGFGRVTALAARRS